MKLNNPLPQSLPKECDKASKIFKSFVDGGNNGLDGVIPRSVLENAKGFAVFTVFKAGFVFSARAGGGVVIARLEDGTWSAPSAIGLAGLGFGGQAGAEVTDFLIVLNSRSAVRQFMAAGSLTLGGNMSLAIGPLGRNGEATGAVNSSGKLAAMYSYSKTKGLFGGVSIEGSVIVERQDANAVAYRSDVTAKQLLSGSVDIPSWAQNLVNTLNACTGMPGGRRWVDDLGGSPSPFDDGYAFSGISSPGAQTPGSSRKSKKSPFPPMSWGQRKDSGSYFASDDHLTSDLNDNSYDRPDYTPPSARRDATSTSGFGTHFETDFLPETRAPTSKLTYSDSGKRTGFNSVDLGRTPPLAQTHARSYSEAPRANSNSYDSNPFAPTIDDDDPFGLGLSGSSTRASQSSRPRIATKPELAAPIPADGIARAIALYDFNAVQSGDLSFKKGQVITVTEKSGDTNTWWKGKLQGREGVFPANFVEVV